MTTMQTQTTTESTPSIELGANLPQLLWAPAGMSYDFGMLFPQGRWDRVFVRGVGYLEIDIETPYEALLDGVQVVARFAVRSEMWVVKDGFGGGEGGRVRAALVAWSRVVGLTERPELSTSAARLLSRLRRDGHVAYARKPPQAAWELARVNLATMRYDHGRASSTLSAI